MRRFRFASLPIWLVTAAMLVLAACGGGGGQAGDDGGPIQMEAAAGFVFDPGEIEATVGQQVVIELENTDSVAHNIEIEAFGVDEDVEAGETITVEFTPDQAGEFEFICNTPGHYEAGMHGTLVVSE